MERDETPIRDEVVITADKVLSFNGSNNYVDLNFAPAEIASFIGDATGINPISGASEINYLTIFFKAIIPSSIPTGATILHFGNTAWSSPRFRLQIHPSNNDRLTVETKDNVSGYSWNAAAKMFDFDKLASLAIVLKRRPVHAGGHIRGEFWSNNVLISSQDNYVGGRTYSPWVTSTLGAKRDTSTGNYADVDMRELILINRDLDSTELATLFGGTNPASDDTILHYTFQDDVENKANPGTFDGTYSATAPTYIDNPTTILRDETPIR